MGDDAYAVLYKQAKTAQSKYNADVGAWYLQPTNMPLVPSSFPGNIYSSSTGGGEAKVDNVEKEVAFANGERSARLTHCKKDDLVTQKARGILALAKHSSLVAQRWKSKTVVGKARYLRRAVEADKAYTLFDRMVYGKDPCFVRPCPVKPHHGFVDSRVVYSADELRLVAKESYKADNESEIILMPKLDAEFSFVRGPETYTVARGHDGVTAGQETNLLDLPCNANDYYGQGVAHIGWTYDDRENQDMLHEGVYVPPVVGHGDNGHCQYVQARTIAKGTMSNNRDFIPPPDAPCWDKDVPGGRVLQTYEPCFYTPNTLEGLLKQPGYFLPGTVFVTNNFASHQACQLILAGWPVVRKAEVGDTLQPSARQPSEEDLQLLAKVIPYWMHPTLPYVKKPSDNKTIYGGDGPTTEQCSTAARNASYTAKALHVMRLDLPLNRKFAAQGLCNLFMLSAIACAGEARHWYERGPGASYKGNPPIGRRYYLKKDKSEASNFVTTRADRTELYFKAAQYGNLAFLLRSLVGARMAFCKPGWGLSYGGRKWARIARRTLDLYRLLRQFCHDPSLANFNLVAGKANSLSYEVHNGGKGALSKFGDTTETTSPYLTYASVERIFNNTPPVKPAYMPKLTSKRAGERRTFLHPHVPADTMQMLSEKPHKAKVILCATNAGEESSRQAVLVDVPAKWRNCPNGLLLYGQSGLRAVEGETMDAKLYAELDRWRDKSAYTVMQENAGSLPYLCYHGDVIAKHVGELAIPYTTPPVLRPMHDILIPSIGVSLSDMHPVTATKSNKSSLSLGECYNIKTMNVTWAEAVRRKQIAYLIQKQEEKNEQGKEEESINPEEFGSIPDKDELPF